MHYFKIFLPYSNKLIVGMSQKQAGSFKEGNPDFKQNIEKLGLGKAITSFQTHSDTILEVTRPFEELPEGDALMTHKKDLLLMVKVADCQGIIIFDPVKEAIGVVHSGWKGSVKNILGKTIQKMKRAYNSNSEDLLISISPSLGPCCSEFTAPKKELPEFCHPFILENNHVDFWQLSKEQCLDEGVLESNIEIAGICTKCDSDYFSHRLGDEGRMAVFAKLI